MLFEKLLVPLDGTAESAVALPIARAMARATGATVTLLRVLAADEEDRTTREAQRELDGIAAELTAGGLTARTVVQTGDPAQTIVAHARMGEADLIVMRTHGRAGLARAVAGSVAERVLTQSPVPLLLLRPGDRYVSQIKSLLVPVDGSPGAALALGAAIGLAQATGASLRLVQVVVPIPAYIYGAYAFNGATYVDPAWDDEARQSAQTYLDALAARLRTSGLAVETQVCIAPSVAEAIGDIAEARGIDLIVMSTEALTGAARAVLGSVADAVVRTARCPVLLERRAAPTVAHEAQQKSRGADLVPIGT